MTTNFLKKLSVFTVSTATIGVSLISTSPVKAASLMGDAVQFDKLHPTESTVYQTQNVTVSEDVELNYFHYFDLDIQDQGFIIDFDYQYNAQWYPAPFNGFKLSDLNFDDGSIISNVFFETNMEGFDASRVSFTDDSVSINWESLYFNSNTEFSVTFETTGGDSVSTPEPGMLTALGLVALGGLLTQKKRSSAKG